MIEIDKKKLYAQIRENVEQLECEGDILVFDHMEDVWYQLYSTALANAVTEVPKKVVVT